MKFVYRSAFIFIFIHALFVMPLFFSFSYPSVESGGYLGFYIYSLGYPIFYTFGPFFESFPSMSPTEIDSPVGAAVLFLILGSIFYGFLGLIVGWLSSFLPSESSKN